MIPAPLRLERYFFDHVQITTRRDFKPGSTETDFEISTNLEIGQVPQPKGMWRVVLNISVRAKEAAPAPPYELDLRALGFFSVAQPGPTEEATATMVGVNGASILYSASREYILMLTGRGPWGAMPIPTVSFLDLKVQKQVPPEIQGPAMKKGRRPGKDARGTKFTQPGHVPSTSRPNRTKES